MISYSELMYSVLIAFLYLLILPFQLVIFPSTYYSVRDIIYSKSLKKAIYAAASRLLFIAFLSFVLEIIGVSKRTILFGIAMGSFLCSWPSIYQYRLFAFFDSEIKFVYFISCILSVVFSISCGCFSINILLPMILKNKEVYVFDNTGFNIIIQLLGMCIPVGVRSVIEYCEKSNPYMDCKTFAADLCMTYRKIKFEGKFVKDYFYEIDRASERNGIQRELLETVLMLELINRKSWFQQKIEYLACRFLPSYVIKHNCTLGLAQISVENAKHYYKMNPRNFLMKMLDIDESIELCAYYLRSLMEKYTQGYRTEDYQDMDCTTHLSTEQKLSLYIASEYICGCNISLRKFTLVYMTIIEDCESEISLKKVG